MTDPQILCTNCGTEIKLTESLAAPIVAATRKEQRTIDIPWSPKPKSVATITRAPGHTDEKLVKSVARAHPWLADLTAGRYACVEDLAAAANINPKVVRQGLRLAFLPPELTMSVLNGEATKALKDIPKTLPLPWAVQREVIG